MRKINTTTRRNINKWKMFVRDLERQKNKNPFTVTLQCAFFGYFSFYYPFFLGIFFSVILSR